MSVIFASYLHSEIWFSSLNALASKSQTNVVMVSLRAATQEANRG